MAGAAVMVVEISANRLLAPLFGNSIYTWTALIGVILVSISIGGYLGGWLADKRSDFGLLGWLLAGAGIMTLLIPAIHSLLGQSSGTSSLIMGPLVVSVVLFAIPGVLLGAVSPASVRLYSKLQSDTHVGFAAGTISMVGSLGSFVGTFASGFYLLGAFGVKSIFLGSGILLILLAGVAFWLETKKPLDQIPVWISALIAGTIGSISNVAAQENVIFEQESFYHKIRVVEQGHGPFAQRYLELDNTTEGGMEVESGDIVLGYQKFWQVPLLKSGMKVDRALFLGAGAFGMPEAVSKKWPSADVEVVEIDPNVIEVGKRFFKLSEFPRVTAHADDARRFLRLTASDKKYDMIFGDAYNGVQAIPVHLASQEFFQLVEDRLSPTGIFVMNVISAVEGEKAALLAGMITTLKEVFPHVAVCASHLSRRQAQNVILVASQDNWEPLFMKMEYTPGSLEDQLTQGYVPELRLPKGGVVFTDDHNPVDAIIARGLRLD